MAIKEHLYRINEKRSNIELVPVERITWNSQIAFVESDKSLVIKKLIGADCDKRSMRQIEL